MRRWGPAPGAVALAALLAGLPFPAGAQAPSGSTFDADPADTLLVGLGLWVTGLGLSAQSRRWSETPACRNDPIGPDALCDRERIFVLDRPTFAHHWDGADAASDVLLLTMLGAPFAYAGVRSGIDDGLDQPADAFGRSAAVSFQALGAVMLATNVLKLVVRRPRPLTYDAGFSREERFDGDARLSFPSGHTSLAFGTATVIAIMAEREVRDPGLRAALIAGSFGAATATGYFRIAARKHFLTDVLAGAALGAGVAALVAGLQVYDDAAPGPDDATGESGWRFAIGGTF